MGTMETRDRKETEMSKAEKVARLIAQEKRIRARQEELAREQKEFEARAKARA
jgi:hypothetical protein